MNTISSCSIVRLGVLVATGCLIQIVSAGDAAAAPLLSDEMVITAPGGGPVVFDNFLPEPAPAGVEPTLTFAGPPVPVAPPIPLAAALGLPGISVVVLTEPAGEPLDPGEVPIFLPGQPNVVISDVVISTLKVDPAIAPPFITLVSDGAPELADIAGLLPGVPGVILLPETGLLQDLTPFLVFPVNNPFGPITVQVSSDVRVPEPASVVLAALSLFGFVACGRRRRRR